MPRSHEGGRALFADGTYPTLTLHAGDDRAAMFDSTTVSFGVRSDYITWAHNEHLLAAGAVKRWELAFGVPGSDWSPDDVAAGRADVYVTRLTGMPRYYRLYTDGRIETPDYGAWTEANTRYHRYPPNDLGRTAYRYYALTISVGRLRTAGEFRPELQEFQLLVRLFPRVVTSPLLYAYICPTETAVRITAPSPADATTGLSSVRKHHQQKIMIRVLKI